MNLYKGTKSTQTHLIIFNKCHIYLKILYISDMTTQEGNEIDPPITKVYNLIRSRYTWTHIKIMTLENMGLFHHSTLNSNEKEHISQKKYKAKQ